MLSLNLSNCGGDDEILETPNKYFMFKGENISQQVLHNIKDKLIYMFTYSFEDNNPTDLKIIAYNYEQKKVIKTNELNFLNTTLVRYIRLEILIIKRNYMFYQKIQYIF